jgi:hypothetical protein
MDETGSSFPMTSFVTIFFLALQPQFGPWPISMKLSVSLRIVTISNYYFGFHFRLPGCLILFKKLTEKRESVETA